MTEMVKNSFKIYARLKKEDSATTTKYEIINTGTFNDIVFRARNHSEFINNKPLHHKFRFHKVFDQESDQAEVFDTIAKPVVNSVLQGFNGTIFAYGQTGSGKTYAITGSSDDYHERGIIPRSIQQIFEFIKNSSDKYTICISYLEIYNEIGYDLLNPNQKFSSSDELPKIVFCEDCKGDFYLRNLSARQVSNEQEAMRLLFLGDTNRTIAETPMNVCSSRSHCIFTVSVTSHDNTSGIKRKSKLNLVDLAGSERVNKLRITGTTLNEAKYINLSLHYLEQVILALSEVKRGHIPYRNSLLTHILKDSLAGSCITVFLATLAVNKKNLEETVATCKFAQRVTGIDMEAIINEEVDPQLEVEMLRKEITSLKIRLQNYTKFQCLGSLTLAETERCKKLVTEYLNDESKDESDILSVDMRHIQFCLKLLKDNIKQESEKKKINSIENELIEKYKKIIQEKEDQIGVLTSLLHTDTSAKLIPPKSIFQPSEAAKLDTKNDLPSTLLPNEKEAFETFMQDPQNALELRFYMKSIEHMHEIAKNLNSSVVKHQKNILLIKYQLEESGNSNLASALKVELQKQQEMYKEALEKLQTIKHETENVKNKLELSKEKVLQKFKEWYEFTDVYKFDVPKENFVSHENCFLLNNEMKKLRRSCGVEQVGDTLDNVTASPVYKPQNTSTPLQELEFLNNYPSHEAYTDQIAEQPYSSVKIQNVPDFSEKVHRFKSSPCSPGRNQMFKNVISSAKARQFKDFAKEQRLRNVSYSSTEEPRREDYERKQVLENVSYFPTKTQRHEDYERNRGFDFVSNSSPETQKSADCKRNQGHENLPYFYARTQGLDDSERIGKIVNPAYTSAGMQNFENTNQTKFFDRSLAQQSAAIESDGNKPSKFINEAFINPDLCYDRISKSTRRETPQHKIFNVNPDNFSGGYDKNFMTYKNNFNYDPNQPRYIKPKSPRTYNYIQPKPKNCCNISFRAEDTREFRDFIQKIPLTGDAEVDEEILNFYRNQFGYSKN